MLQIRKRVQRPRTSKSAEKWHQDVKKARQIFEFLLAGNPPPHLDHLNLLQQPTADYLKGLKTKPVTASAECDDNLVALVDEYARREYLTRGEAIFACLYALSIPVATRYLVSLIDLDVQKYLQCITLAGHINPLLVSKDEFLFAQSLLGVISDQGQNFHGFQCVVEAMVSGVPKIFINLTIVQSALMRSDIRDFLRRQLEPLLEQKYFMTIWKLISWIHDVPTIQKYSDVMAVMKMHLPMWPWLMAWRPNLDRIGEWEVGRFTDPERTKLSHLFDLDGPDTATHRHESLKMSEPRCYQHIDVRPQKTETLERLLELLYRAHLLGLGAMELFIYLCIDKTANESSLLMAENAVRTADDSHCKLIHVTLQGLAPQASLSRQMRSLTQALHFLKDDRTPERVSSLVDQLVDRLKFVFELAQVEFCAQLEKGTGEFIGMLIYNLGKAILQVSCIHSRLPGILPQIQQFPPQDAVEALFDQIQDEAELTNVGGSRFKRYLASSLGGKNEANFETMTLAAIQEEVQFWKHPPDSCRKDLAKTLANFQSISYTLYTSCLLVMLREEDLFVNEIRQLIKVEDEQTCLNFAIYLSGRRQLNQLQDNCWILLLVAQIKEQVSSFLPRTANSMSFGEWLKVVDDLTHLLMPIRLQLPPSGRGLTQERLLWWQRLSQNMTAVKFLVERQARSVDLTWLYFPSDVDHVVSLLEILKQERSMAPINRRIMAYLAHDGNNVSVVCDCIKAINQTSTMGQSVCERMLSRLEVTENEGWHQSEIGSLFEAWHQSASLNQLDKVALKHIRRVLDFSVTSQMNANGFKSASRRLQSDYKTLIDHAKKLENLRRKLRHQRPRRISALLQRLGIDDTSSGRATDAGVPNGLLDAVELVGEDEYEISFALTGLSDLQRLARGIYTDSRLLLVRLRLKGVTQFCIHFSPNDEVRGSHNFWRVSRNREPDSAICTTKPSLFTYYVGRKINQLLQKGNPTIHNIHSAILKLITASPATCLLCSNPMSVKQWKASTCSKQCSIKLRKAPLEVRLHNLLFDPLSVDLLLTCVYAAAADMSNLQLLPGCPVNKANIRAVIDSLPPLANLQTAIDLQAAIRGLNATYAKQCEDLLSWLCLAFRGFMLNAPPGFRIPSMPNTQQFLVLNSNHEREQLFNAQPGSGIAKSGVVFHGTQISRLFLILTEGLKSMSNTEFMANGSARGPGIYCGDEQSTSQAFAGNIGQSWRNSALSNMNVLLGCEIANYRSTSVHVVADKSILVRYVFLLPAGYANPPRRHVEQAMKTTCALLRSGLLT